MLLLSGVTHQNQNEMVSRLTEAINAVGWLLDARLFADSSASLKFEIAASRIGGLEQALAAAGLALSELSVGALQQAAQLAVGAEQQLGRGALRAILRVSLAPPRAAQAVSD